MLSTSFEFRQKIADGAPVHVKAVIVFADGEARDLTGDDFMLNKFSFEQNTSSLSSFDIGAAIVGGFTCTLNNFDRRFEADDFTGARILPFVGIELDSGSIEWLRKGTYWIDQPDSYGETIGLKCRDSMCKLDRPWDAGTKFPSTAATIVLDICAQCGVPLLYAGFANASAVMKVAPPANATCRDVLSWVAQATGNYARMTADDRLELAWYDPSAYEGEDWLDGDAFDDASPYASGSDADGGNFFDYSAGDSYDGGSFDSGKIVNLYAYTRATIVTDDVVITGVRVTASDEVLADGSSGADGESHLAGSEGYVLDISGNPMIAYGEARATAERVAAQCAGITLRPFDVTGLGDPRIEAGDPVVITDRYQNTHRGFLTTVIYPVGSHATYRCTAETPSRNNSTGSNAHTAAIQRVKDALKREQTAREAAQQRFQDDLANSAGMYATTKTEGGAATWYLHDKPKLEESQLVWKVNAAGLGLSTDGGKNYPYGIDKWGSAILNSIYAVGIDADHITTGAIRVKNKSRTIFCADMRTGQFWWDVANSSLLNDGTLTVKKGNIGGFEIGTNYIRSNRAALTAASAGVYIGPDGMSTGNGYQWNAMGNGAFFGGYNGNAETGYVDFNTRWKPSNTGGTRIAGKGCLALLSPNVGIAGWHLRSAAETTITVGQTKTQRYVESLALGPTPYITAYTTTINYIYGLTFTKSGNYLTGANWTNYTLRVVTGIGYGNLYPGIKSYTNGAVQFTQGLMVTA